MHLVRFLKSVAAFLLTYHFFIGSIAMLLALETNILLHQSFQYWHLYAFIFCATHFAYNVYYIKTDRRIVFGILSLLSLTAGIFLFFALPSFFYPRLFFIALASCMYIFPVFFSVKKDNSFTVQKLLLLVFIWVAATWVLPAQNYLIDYRTLILLLYRIVFLGIACLLFFIRDEKNERYRHLAGIVIYFLVALQLILSILVIIFIHVLTGLVFLFSTLCCLCLVLFLSRNKRSPVFYLAFADGVLFLQASIIIFLYFLQAL